MLRIQIFCVVFLGGVLVAVAGCDTAGPDASPSITDTWEGQVTSQGTSFSFTLDLTEGRDVVTGVGAIESSQGTAAFSVQGSYAHPSISLQLQFTEAGRPPVSLVGSVTNDRSQIQAQLTGSGFGGEAITLARR